MDSPQFGARCAPARRCGNERGLAQPYRVSPTVKEVRILFHVNIISSRKETDGNTFLTQEQISYCSLFTKRDTRIQLNGSRGRKHRPAWGRVMGPLV